MSRTVSFVILLAVITLLSLVFFRILASFLVPMFLAALLVVIFRPFHQWVLSKLGSREKIAAGVTTAGILLAVLIPFSILTLLAIGEGTEMVRNFKPATISQKLEDMRKGLGLDFPVASEVRAIDLELDAMSESRGINDLASHQEAWYRIQELSRLIGRRMELSTDPQPLADDGDTEDDQTEAAATTLDPWQDFLNYSRASYELDYETAELPDTTAEDQEQRLDKLNQYHGLLDDTRQKFVEAKHQLAGGRFWMPLKLLANPDDEQVAEYSSGAFDYLREKVVSLGSKTGAFLISLGIGGMIMIISLYFFLLDGPKMMESLHGLFPMDDAHERELVQEFNNVSRAVVLATLLSALAQGILAGIGFYVCGLDAVFLLTLLTFGLAMVPFIGAAAVWVPCAIYLYVFEGNLTAAIGLAVYGAVVVSMVDNLIKPYVLHGQSNLHPLVALLSVLGGVTALGPIGILVGPMVVVFLQTLLKILQREMKMMEDERPHVAAASGGAVMAADDVTVSRTADDEITTSDEDMEGSGEETETGA
ncbi:MAG: AI-2E family transporter [Planctomycetota bacterium]